MLAGMTSAQVTEWMAFYALEHLGEEADFRADLRAGIVAATVANANRGKNQRAVTPEELMPRFGPRYDSPEEIHRQMLALARAPEGSPRPKANARRRPDGDPDPAEAGGRVGPG